MPRRRDVLKTLATGAALAALPVAARPARAADARPRYGWNPSVAGRTDASLYVSPDGDDGNPGTLERPLRTVQAGVRQLAALGAGSLAIRGGIYREAVTLKGLRGPADAPVAIHRYGTERPTISAAEVVGGWRPVDGTEAGALGFAEGTVYVTTLPDGMLAHGAIYALNLYEAGEWTSIATERADPGGIDNPSDQSRFFQAEPAVDGAGKLRGFTDARLKGMSAASLTDARVLVWHAPNLVSPDTIATYDPATGQVTLAGKDRKAQRNGNTPVVRYALQNVTTGMAPGRWLVRRRPGGGVDLYLYPRDPANLAHGIEISTRGTCLDLADAENVVLTGLEFIRSAGDDRKNGAALRHVGGKGGGERPTRGITITDCRVGETFSSAARGDGAILIHGLPGLTLRAVTLDRARGSFGLAMRDCPDARLSGLHLTGVSQSAARFFAIRRMVFAFSLIEDSGWEAHANKFNFYEGSDQILVYGIRTRNTGGYVTFQEASRIHFAFCEFDASAKGTDNRALVSQNRPAGAGQGGPDGSGDPVAGGTFWYWNLTLAPAPHPGQPAGALDLGPKGNSQRHAFHNCVIFGGGYGDIYTKGAPADMEQRSFNIYTGLAWWQSAKKGWHPAQGEVVASGAVAGGAGRDMREAIAAQIAPLFPDFTDWDRDIDGNPVDWSRPPVGSVTY